MVSVSKVHKRKFIEAVRINFGTAVGWAKVDLGCVIEISIQQLRPVNLVTEVIDVSGGRNHTAMIVSVHQHREALLAHAINAPSLPALFLSLRQGWQQQRRQNGNDCNNHEQFDQGKTNSRCLRFAYGH